MIPKIIHYCWFGSNIKPKSVQRYIDNWHQMLPNYELMEWNESNCNLDKEIDYVKEAYAAKKYAFVSDYIRVKKLYEYGGIYLDTDVKIVRDFEKHLKDARLVLGFQGIDNILTAFIASEKNHPLIEEFLQEYQSRKFVLEDGSYDMTSINVKMDRLVENYGINLHKDSKQYGKDGLVIYPTEIFCAFDLDNWHPVVTDNTCTIHYMASSWRGTKVQIKIKIIKLLQLVLGTNGFDQLKKMLKRK